MKKTERQTGNKVKRIVCDRAPEFIGPNSELGKLIKDTGIDLVPSCGYTSNENSKAENAHKMRGEVARTIRIKARLPRRFWAEAGQFARIIKGMILQICVVAGILLTVESRAVGPPNFDLKL